MATLSKGLQKYARTHNFEIKKDVAFGFYRNYAVTVGNAKNNKSIKYISVAAVLRTEEEQINLSSELGGLREIKGVSAVSTTKTGVRVDYIENAFSCELAQQLTEDVINKLTEKNILGAGYCTLCGEKAENCERVLIGDTVCFVHGNCLAEVEEQIKTECINAEKTGSTGLGIIGAMIGAIVGILPWMVLQYFGWYVSYLGFLAAICAKKGYELFKGKNTKVKSVAVAVTTVIAVILGDFILSAIFIAQEYTYYTFGEAVYLHLTNLIFNTEYLLAVLGNLAMGMIFAVLGIVGVIHSINQTVAGGKNKIQRI